MRLKEKYQKIVYRDPYKSTKQKQIQSKIMTQKILNREFSPHSNYKNGYLYIKTNKTKIFYRSLLEKQVLSFIDTRLYINDINYEPFKLRIYCK